MADIAIIENSKDFLMTALYNIRYGRKFKKLGIDKGFIEKLALNREGPNEKEVLALIKKSKSKENFSENIRDFLKSKGRCFIYASQLLIGNLTGNYNFSRSYGVSLDKINIDQFTKENQEILPILKSHFYEYVINNNQNKNSFAKEIKVKNEVIRDLSKDIDKEELEEQFDKFISGESIEDYDKNRILSEYLIDVIGTYSRDDIENKFNFILYDMENKDSMSLDERRKKYELHSSLSENQLKKINEVSLLENRLHSINNEKSKELLSRLEKIKSDLDINIEKLEDIYSDYEILFREDLVDKLYVPEKDVTVIEYYKDLRPQLIHTFMPNRNPEKFRDMEIEKLKEKIISERKDGDKSEKLTNEEKEKFEKMMSALDANIDKYKVNYVFEGMDKIYHDSTGIGTYYSDTTNQISASIKDGKDFIYSRTAGIIGIGFNKESLTPEAIAISSKSYKTTNRGINNIEYHEKYEFDELSAPFSELVKSNGNSEVVMQRRGIDFDTKASYILVQIDSSNEKQTKQIMEQVEKIRNEEGLKVVIHDVYKIRKSYEKDKEKQVEIER